MTDHLEFGKREVGTDGKPIDVEYVQEPNPNEERRQTAHARLIDAVENYTLMILTSMDIPVARRAALVAQLGKLTGQIARLAPLPNMGAALARRPVFGGGQLVAYGDEDGYPDEPMAFPPPNDLGVLNRQAISALQDMQKPKEVDRARTLEALIASRDALSRDYDLSRDPPRQALVAKLDGKIERLIEELAPDAPPPADEKPQVNAPLHIPDYEGD